MGTTIYRSGICYCSVCTDEKDMDQLTDMVNMINPSGTENGWKLSDDKTFSDGEPNPCPCEQIEGHMHHLFVC